MEPQINLTIKGLPQLTHRKLQQRAKRHRRSLNKEIIAVLEDAVSPHILSPAELVDQLRTMQAKMRFSVSIGEIESAINSGRE